MDRIIEVKVSGDYISKDNNFAGVCGSGNVTCLRITFDKDWKEYAKKITFWNARGLNPVEITLTTNLLEDTPENTEVTEVYIVTIPAEPLEFSGMLTFVVEGYDAVKDENGNIIGEKRVRCVPCELEVEDAPVAAGLPVDPTPTQAEQLQEQIDEIIDTIHEAKEAETNAKKYADEASDSESNVTSMQMAVEIATDNVLNGLTEVKAYYRLSKECSNDAEKSMQIAQESAESAEQWANHAEETVAATAKKDLSNVSEETLQNRVYKIAEATSDDGVHYVATVEGVTELYRGLQIKVKFMKSATVQKPYLNVNGLGALPIRPGNNEGALDFNTYSADTRTYLQTGGSYTLTYFDNGSCQAWKNESQTKVDVGYLTGLERNNFIVGGEYTHPREVTPDEVRGLVGAASQTDLEEVKTSLENNKPIITKNTTVTIPAHNNVTYTTLWNDDLTSLILTTDAGGLSSDNLSSDFGIWIEAPNRNTIGSVLSEEETDVVKIVRGSIAVVGSNIFGVVDGENYTVTISNLTSADVNVFVEELRLNETFTKHFATQSKVEEIVKGETTVLDARLETVETELSVKANTEYVDAAILALDDGESIKKTTLSVPSGESVTHTFTLDSNSIKAITILCNDKDFASLDGCCPMSFADAEFSVYASSGEEYDLYTDIVNQAISGNPYIKDGEELVLTITNQTNLGYVTPQTFTFYITETRVSKIDGRLTAVENEVMSVTQVISETFTLKPINAKEYEIPDGYKCTSINVKATPSVDGQYGSIVLAESAFNSPFATTTLSTARVYDEVVISDIPDECNIIMVNYREGATDTTCTFDVELTYKKTSALDERLTKVESSVGDIETALDSIIAMQNELIGGDSV